MDINKVELNKLNLNRVRLNTVGVISKSIDQPPEEDLDGTLIMEDGSLFLMEDGSYFMLEEFVEKKETEEQGMPKIDRSLWDF